VPERRAIAGAIFAAVACAGGTWAFAASQAGCELQGVCDQSTIYVPAAAEPKGQGPYVNGLTFPSAGMFGNVWQSSPLEGTWVPFAQQVTYVIYPQLPDGGLFVGPYTYPQIYISADANPYTNPGSSFSEGAGNAVNITGLPPSDAGLYGFEVTNNTCTAYYLFLQVAQEGSPNVPPPATPDASAPTDASGDGSADGSPDGSPESGAD